MVWLPVSLECVDTDGSVLCDVGVEDFGEKEALRWAGGEIPT